MGFSIAVLLSCLFVGIVAVFIGLAAFFMMPSRWISKLPAFQTAPQDVMATPGLVEDSRYSYVFGAEGDEGRSIT